MKGEKLHLSIVCPEKTVFDGDVIRVTVPGSVGLFTMLPHHAPIVSSLKKGTITYVTDAGEQSVDIENGFVEMSGETVSACITMNIHGNK